VCSIALEGVCVWVGRNAMNADGISYLDMGNAFFHHIWHMAINAYWSPMYPWMEGFFLWLVGPSAHWEFFVVHLVNLLIFIGALASFEFFLRAFINFHGRTGGTPESAGSLPEWAWCVLGYSLFIWTALIMIEAGTMVSPDLCVAALVYLAAGLLLRMRSGIASWRTFVLFGAVLGFGYLAKAVMFPLAFVFLAVAVFSLSSLRKAALRVLISALVFAAVASPWLILLSRAKERLTFGDSGRVNYECYIDGYAMWFPKSPALKHPMSVLVSSPPTYDFATPVGGTYPLWYDTSYWHEGATPHFDAKAESRSVAITLIYYLHLIVSPRLQFYLVAGLLALFWLNGKRLNVKAIGSNWPVIVPAMAAIGGYSLIHTEYRFVGAYFTILWMALFSGARLPATRRSGRLATAIVVALGVWSFYRPIYVVAKTHVPAYWQAAEALNDAGVKPGDKIAVIGLQTSGMYVAHLAKTQIIAQVREKASDFWRGSPVVRSRVMQVLEHTAAKAVLASSGSGEPREDGAGRDGSSAIRLPADLPASNLRGGWQRLGSTRYYVYLLDGITAMGERQGR
jgi:hypothetical protein